MARKLKITENEKYALYLNSAPQLLKRVRDLRENKVGLCGSAINRKTFPTEVTFGRLWKTYLKGDVLLFIYF